MENLSNKTSPSSHPLTLYYFILLKTLKTDFSKPNLIPLSIALMDLCWFGKVKTNMGPRCAIFITVTYNWKKSPVFFKFWQHFPIVKRLKGSPHTHFLQPLKGGCNPVVAEGNFHPLSPIGLLSSFKPMQLQWLLALFSAYTGWCIFPAPDRRYTVKHRGLLT